MPNAPIIVGEILNVCGSSLNVHLSDSLKSGMPIVDGTVYRVGQIGTFLKIPLGYSNLYGVVTQVGASAIPENLREKFADGNYEEVKNNQWLSMVLVGELIGKRFERGISQFPSTGDAVQLVTLEDLSIIYGGFDDNNSVDVGNISLSTGLVAKLDLNKLVSRHFSVLGSTGSGKSNAVGIVLKAITQKNFKSSRILLIDPHGEYNDVFKSSSSVFKIRADDKNTEKEFYIPFWALPFNELMSIFGYNLSDANKDYIRSAIAEAKAKTVKDNKIDIPTELVTADTPVPFSIRKLWFELDDFERKTFNESRKPETVTDIVRKGDMYKLISNEYAPASPGGGAPYLNHQAKGILGFLDTIRLKLKDSRYSFLFEPGDYAPDEKGKTRKDLSDLLMEWLATPNQITILDLSSIPNEIMPSISGTLLKIVYDALFWGQNLPIGGRKQPLLMLLEEAHNYLRAGEDSVASRIVQKIAKEGRKYGVGLGLITQRPSELDETVLSQCGTMIALRMNNSKDRNYVRATISDDLQTLTDVLPSLRTGEAIISGEGVKIPSRIQFHVLTNVYQSPDPKVSECWMSESLNATECKQQYEQLVQLWQNQKI